MFNALQTPTFEVQSPDPVFAKTGSSSLFLIMLAIGCLMHSKRTLVKRVFFHSGLDWKNWRIRKIRLGHDFRRMLAVKKSLGDFENNVLNVTKIIQVYLFFLAQFHLAYCVNKSEEASFVSWARWLANTPDRCLLLRTICQRSLDPFNIVSY